VVQSPWNQFRVPSLFEDPLSDQVPSEELWSKPVDEPLA
jgi:hypothetical protein